MDTGIAIAGVAIRPRIGRDRETYKGQNAALYFVHRYSKNQAFQDLEVDPAVQRTQPEVG